MRLQDLHNRLGEPEPRLVIACWQHQPAASTSLNEHMCLSINDQSLPLYITGHGCLTLNDTQKALYELNDSSHAPDRIIDLEEIEEFNYQAFEMIRLSSTACLQKVPNPYRCAAIATRPLSTAVARMWQMLNEQGTITIEIFPDEERARQWLGETGDSRIHLAET